MRGGDKLLEEVNGRPCLRVLVDRASEAGAVVIVTLPSPDHPRNAALEDHPARRVFVPNATQGMSVSIKAGIAAVPDGATGVMVLPGDMPDITTADMLRLWDCFERDQPVAVQATTETGERGHPIIFSAQLFDEFGSLDGDRGAFRVLQAHEADLAYVALSGQRARLDLDTPEDWATWRLAKAP